MNVRIMYLQQWPHTWKVQAKCSDLKRSEKNILGSGSVNFYLPSFPSLQSKLDKALLIFQCVFSAIITFLTEETVKICEDYTQGPYFKLDGLKYGKHINGTLFMAKLGEKENFLGPHMVELCRKG